MVNWYFGIIYSTQLPGIEELTNSHLNPNVSEKMRNHLAEDMLDGNMLYLLKKYDETLECRTSLTGAIKLLEITSTCI